MRSLKQGIQNQIGGFDDPLVAWSQVRCEGLACEVLQSLDVANGDFGRLLVGELLVSFFHHAARKFFGKGDRFTIAGQKISVIVESPESG